MPYCSRCACDMKKCKNFEVVNTSDFRALRFFVDDGFRGIVTLKYIELRSDEMMFGTRLIGGRFHLFDAKCEFTNNVSIKYLTSDVFDVVAQCQHPWSFWVEYNDSTFSTLVAGFPQRVYNDMKGVFSFQSAEDALMLKMSV